MPIISLGRILCVSSCMREQERLLGHKQLHFSHWEGVNSPISWPLRIWSQITVGNEGWSLFTALGQFCSHFIEDKQNVKICVCILWDFYWVACLCSAGILGGRHFSNVSLWAITLDLAHETWHWPNEWPSACRLPFSIGTFGWCFKALTKQRQIWFWYYTCGHFMV